MIQFLQTLQGELTQWGEQLVSLIPNVALSLLVVIITFIIAKHLRRVVRRRAKSSSLQDTLNTLLSTTSYVVVLAIGFFFALEILQLEKAVTSLLAGAGIIGLALAFAFQDIVSNFVSGIIIAVKGDLFDLHDLVQTGDYFGSVEAIDLRTTTLRVPSGQTVLIPNSDILSNPLTNFSHTGERRVDIECGVGYDDDLADAQSAVKDALHDLACVDDEKGIDFFYDEFGGSSMNFTARFWIDFDQSNKEYLAAKSDAIKAVKTALDEHGFDIPYPIRTIDIDQTTRDVLRDGR